MTDDDDLSDIQLDDSDYARGEPIPLDVIAKELRRDSPSPKAPDRPNTPPPVDLDEPEVPLISAQELEELIDEVEAPPSNGRPRTALPDDGNGPTARKSSDVLSDRLVQVRQKSETVERQRTEAITQNRELRQQLGSVRDSIDNRIETLAQKVSSNESDEAIALRRELELVRSRAAGDLDALRKKLLETTQASDSSRNVELEAELQALRQEAAVLRHAVKEKDKVLEDLANQCRSLEDLVEDRDREMEQLYRDLEHNREDLDGPDRDSQAGAGGQKTGGNWDADSSHLYGYRDKESTEIMDGTSLIYLPGKQRNWKVLLLASVGGLLLGVLVLEVFFLATGKGEMFSHLLSDTGGETIAAPPATSPPTAESATPPTAPMIARQSPASTTPAATTEKPVTPSPAPVPTAPRTLRDRLKMGGTGPEMVLLPAGDFIMGDRRAVLNSDATPAHRVKVRQAWVSATEVSFDDYDRFARATNRSRPKDEGWGRGRQPVVHVSWDDAQAYTRWLSQQTGKAYRLPSESEWEYAARGGSEQRYWWGFSLIKGQAVCFDCGSRWDGRQTAPVGSLAANPFGLYDTAGNVMEWVQDCYNPSYSGAPADGAAWLSGDCTQRVVRGGAYNKPASSLRNAFRAKMPREAQLQNLGFRVAREP